MCAGNTNPWETHIPVTMVVYNINGYGQSMTKDMYACMDVRSYVATLLRPVALQVLQAYFFCWLL